MSYDISFEVEYKEVHGDDTFNRTVAEFNHTYNLSKFFRDFLNFEDEGLGEVGINGFYGMFGKDAYFVLNKAVKTFNQSDINHDWFKDWAEKEYNPENGHGSVDTAMKLLTDMMNTCKEYPTSVIKIY